MPLRDPRSTQTMTDTQFWSMCTLTLLLQEAASAISASSGSAAFRHWPRL